MRSLSFDLLILDVMMPHESGLDFARSLRNESQVPILMLTARAEPEQRIEGLETGVDDYLAKPFDPRELLLRVSNVLRRGGAAALVRRSAHGRVRVPYLARRAEARRRDGPAHRARARPVALFRPAPRHAGVAAGACQGRRLGGERAVDVQINRLRRKIEHDPANPVYLQTVRGKGYILYSE